VNFVELDPESTPLLIFPSALFPPPDAFTLLSEFSSELERKFLNYCYAPKTRVIYSTTSRLLFKSFSN